LGITLTSCNDQRCVPVTSEDVGTADTIAEVQALTVQTDCVRGPTVLTGGLLETESSLRVAAEVFGELDGDSAVAAARTVDVSTALDTDAVEAGLIPARCSGLHSAEVAGAIDANTGACEGDSIVVLAAVLRRVTVNASTEVHAIATLASQSVLALYLCARVLA
jgi:hypothetical protein